MWICQHCGADVEQDWEVCWSCTRPRDPEGRPVPSPAQSRRRGPSAGFCPQCQSSAIIQGVQVTTIQGPVLAHLPESPDALFFKGGVGSRIAAEVCGECGYIMFRATEPGLLLHLHQRLQRSREGEENSQEG